MTRPKPGVSRESDHPGTVSLRAIIKGEPPAKLAPRKPINILACAAKWRQYLKLAHSIVYQPRNGSGVKTAHWEPQPGSPAGDPVLRG